jgi:hypothetical protein
MAEARYRRYTQFDFAASNAWQQYFNNITPVPPPQRLDRIKKQWYKRNVDPSFDSDWVPGPPTPFLSTVAAVLVILSLPALLIHKSLHFILVAHFACVIRDHGMPKLQMAYWRGTIFDLEFQNAILCLVFLITQPTAIWIVPTALGAIPIVAEAFYAHPQVPRFITNKLKEVRDNKNQWLQTKSDIEVGLGIGIIGMLLMNAGSLMLLLIYWQIIRVKYMINNYTKASFTKLRQAGDFHTRTAPAIIQTVWSKLKSGCEYLVTIDQQAPGSSCTIF